MEPPRSHPLASDVDQQGVHDQGNDDPVANDDNTLSMWDIMQEYIHILDNSPRSQHQDDDVVLALYQPGQHDYAKTQEESMERVAAQPMATTCVPSAGYNMLPLQAPPLAGNNSKMFVVAGAADPLQLSIGTHVPAANYMLESSSYTGSSNINMNLLPPEKKTTVTIPNNTSSNLTTKKPYELPLLGLIGKKHPPPFAPVILESSEVPVCVLPSLNMAPAKAKHKRRHYIWPAHKVAKIDEKIEQLRKEALLRPAHRRPMVMIQKDFYELQDKKDEIHARMLDMMREDEDEEDTNTSTQQ